MPKSGTVKDLLIRGYFSWYGYLVIVSKLVTAGLLQASIGGMRLLEKVYFECKFLQSTESDNDFTGRCYEMYEEQFDSPLPIYGFVMLGFVSELVVCLSYTCYMKCKIRTDRIATTDKLAYYQRRRIFFCYFLQLVARVGLGILLTILQKIFYPLRIPIKFTCVLPSVQPWNVTHFNATNNQLQQTNRNLNCDIPFASEKSVVALANWIINIAFTILVVGEILYLVNESSKDSDFISDPEFHAVHFKNQISTCEFKKRMKKGILQQTRKLEELSDSEDEQLIDDIFVRPMMYLEKEDRKVGYENMKEFLIPPNKRAGSGAKVLIVGNPGTGKSFLCKKLLYDWSKADHDRANGFDFVFYRNFNSYQTTSLQKLLRLSIRSEDHSDDHVFRRLLREPEKVLLILDCLDELEDDESGDKHDNGRYENNPTLEMPGFALYSKLLQGKLLRRATILTTCRLNAITSLNDSWFDKIVQIDEFTPKERVFQFVKNYCKRDEDCTVAERMIEHIQQNVNLLLLCFIPAICRIVCHLLKDVVSERCMGRVRTTNIYERTLKLFISKHHPEYRKTACRGTEHFSNSVEQQLTDLGKIAIKGISEGQKKFATDRVAAGIRNCGLLKITSDQSFLFSTPNFQEFLAAKEIVKMDPVCLSDFITMHAKDTKWHLVIFFVAGLLRGHQNGGANELCSIPHRTQGRQNNRETSLPVRSLVSCLHESLMSNPTEGELALLMMKCLYEYNDEDTVKRAASELQSNSRFNKEINLKNCRVKPADCAAIVYFLNHLKLLQYSVDLSDNFISGSGPCKELGELLRSGGPTKLDLRYNKISVQDLQLIVEGRTQIGKCELLV